MTCDFYTETSLVIEYYNAKGEVGKIASHTKRKRGFIDKYVPSSDKFEKKLKKKVSKNSFIKMIYENTIWFKEGYQEKYETKLRRWFPQIKDFIKIYKASIAWPV